MQPITKDDVVNIEINAATQPKGSIAPVFYKVKGYALKDVPGLGVMRTLRSNDGPEQQKKGSWVIVHLQSGYTCSAGTYPWPTAMQALIVMRAIKDLTDWTAHHDVITTIVGLKTKLLGIYEQFHKAGK